MRCSRHGRAIAVMTRVLALALLILPLQAHAQDLGVIGPVYAISEPNLLDVILAKLRAAEASGLLGKLQREARAKVSREIREPAPVTGLMRTTRPRSFYYDPSIIVPYAITDAGGKVIFAPGTRVNPLDIVSLTTQLLFIDGRDPAQVARAQNIHEQHPGRLKLILTGGSYLDLMHRLHRPVYFDQAGSLTTKLGIHQVPALVSQDGKRLRIDEIL